MKEMTTGEWKNALDILWSVGIPQVVFIGGESTLRPDFVEILNHAQQFVTGLETNGRKLAAISEDLHRVRLNYVQVTLQSDSQEVHDKMVGVHGAWQETVGGIVRAKEVGLQVFTNTTLTRENVEQFLETIRFGKKLGLTKMACNSLICSGRSSYARAKQGLREDELKEVLTRALDLAQEIGVDLKWPTPTCYKVLNPMELGFGVKCCSAGQYSMTIEPDGMVIPCEAWFHQKVGHILNDPWLDIWGNPVCVNLRKRSYLKNMQECHNCSYLDVCGGGCPLEQEVSP